MLCISIKKKIGLNILNSFAMKRSNPRLYGGLNVFRTSGAFAGKSFVRSVCLVLLVAALLFCRTSFDRAKRNVNGTCRKVIYLSVV